MDSKTKKTQKFEVRFLVKSDSDPELYQKLKDMMDHLAPIKPSEVYRYIIDKAHEYWFTKEIKQK